MAVRGSQSGMAEAFLHPGVGRNARLESLAARLDWGALEAALPGLRQSGPGAPSYPALVMFKALLLQQWYGLSDPGLEEALCDRMSFRRFVGLMGDEAAPDHSTLWRFRQALGAHGLDARLFEAINAQLDAQGLVVKQGTLIDASLIAAASRPPPPPAAGEVKGGEVKGGELKKSESRLVRAAREPEADWTRRGAKRHFGYKAHVAVDRGSNLIRRVKLTPASRNETLEADGLIMGDEKEIWAGKAYDSHARRTLLKERRIRNRICRRGNKHQEPSPWSNKRNALIGRVRGRVETIFAVLKRHYGFARARYLTLQRNLTGLLMASIAINLRRTLVLAG